MNQMLDSIDARLEAVIWEGDHAGALDEAAVAIEGILDDLTGLEGLDGEAEVRRRGLHAFTLMRKANIARQHGDPEAAAAVDREALAIARTADDLTLGRCLLSMAASEFASGRPDDGGRMLDEARSVLDAGTSPDHAQALGWSRVLYLDVVNAGMLQATEEEVAAAAGEALQILRTIRNWAGVSRVLAALSAFEKEQGHPDVAAALQGAAAAYDTIAAGEQQ